MTAHVAVALGSNLGDRAAHLRAGVVSLVESGFEVARASSVYESAPVGLLDQPDFLNAAVVGSWPGDAHGLLAAARRAEGLRERKRSVPNGPRTLDVDLILYGTLVLTGPDLVIPHPRWKGRAFVLAPLAEIAPHWRDPVTGATIEDLWRRWSSDLDEARIVAPSTDLWSDES